jgi:MtN3 and saliva related transmembrane protein
MLAALTLGLTLWIIYGVIQGDWIIIGSNAVGATLGGIVLGCKVRDLTLNRPGFAGGSNS